MGAVPAVRADGDDALGADDLCGLLDRLARREVSAQELRDAAIARIQTVDPALNALTIRLGSPPRTEIVVPDDAPFAGVPTVLKDNEDLTGYPTSHGSRAVSDRPARTCSPWVAQYLRLGLVPLGKTTLGEFGLTATTESSRFGATRNPWDPARSAGGSSGGSAALVAAGAVPIAHANDGGGSIRIPAACCGLVGLKPSRGRLLDRPELARMPVPLTTQGVLTRTVRDTARYYAEVEKLYRAPGLPPIGLVTGPGRPRLRIAVLTRGSRGIPVDPATVAGVQRTAALCESLGHRVDEIDAVVNDQFGPDFLLYWALLSFLLRYGGRALFGPGFDGRRVEPLTQALADRLRHRASSLPGAVRRLRRLAVRHEAAFEQVDVILSPVVAHETPPIGFLGPDVPVHDQLVRLLRFISFTPVHNVSGAPAISMPAGRSPRGLPIGVQVAAPVGQERRLLELAFELEAAAGQLG